MAAGKIIFGRAPELPYALEESLNRLRINISFLGSDVRKIMIVSSEPNEGKSFLAFNLWRQMGLAGDKTVLIDADMRKSTMVDKYLIEREDGALLKGTSHYLSGNSPLGECMLQTEIPSTMMMPNVDNIVNPSMLLENKRFENMLDVVASKFRYVFIDVPPLGLVSDAERIGNLCDGAILCVRGSFTSKAIVRESVQRLERANCPLLGFVLNRAETQKAGYYHKYTNRYYSSKYYSDQYYRES